MFYALVEDDVVGLKRLFAVFEKSKQKEEFILCSSRYFELVEKPAEGDVVEYVEMFYTYVKNLFPWSVNPAGALRSSPDKISRLLGFHIVDNTSAKLRERTLVGAAYQAGKGKKISLKRVPIPMLTDIIRSSLSTYLKEQIKRETDLADVLRRTLVPCVNLVAEGTCQHRHEDPVSHVLDQSWHASRVSFHLKQIEILEIAHSMPQRAGSLGDRIFQKRLNSWYNTHTISP